MPVEGVTSLIRCPLAICYEILSQLVHGVNGMSKDSQVWFQWVRWMWIVNYWLRLATIRRVFLRDTATR